MADPIPFPPEKSLTDTDGISEDDRRDIITQIERVSQENRLQATPETFVLKARKKGLMVPLAVNLGALLVLIAGLLILYFLFRQSAQNLVQNQVALQSTEGKLLEELKKESESQLLAKDQQIADIQKRMETLGQQKNELQNTMDEKIAAKEAELKQELQEALQAERTRLAKAGYSEAVIEERLKVFEAQKNAEFAKTLAEFKAKADADRVALENNLKKQQDDYQKNLSDLAGERQRILDDSKKRQNELQAQLDQKTRDLEAQQTSSRAQLAQAQQQLNDLNDQRAKTESVQNQLLGLYTKTAQAIQSRQFPEAMNQIQALVSYLNEPSVKVLPDIQKRRDTDLFLAQTLIDWLTQDQKRLDADAARVQVTQNDIDTIQNLTQQAQQALAANRADEAEALYTKALGQVPAVLEAHQYFLAKALKAEQARQKALADAVAAGDAALLAGQFSDALRSYQLALDALPLTPAQREAFAGHWGQAFFETELPNRLTKLDAAAASDLSTAQALLKANQPAESMAAYVSILGKYPVGQVGFASLTGIRQSTNLLREPSPRELALNAELAKVKDDFAQLQAQQQNQPKTTPAASASDSAKAAQDEAARLRPQALALQAMTSRFQDFLTKDDPLWAQTPDSTQILQSKLLLNDFLGSSEVNTAFPGLDDKVGRYENSFLEAGQKEGLINVNDTVSNLTQLASNDERKQYLTSLQTRYADNPTMTAFLANLAALF